MRIKKIELVGFKSFKDRTVIHFDAGITGIVGPNGCGKSNIVDALVWVMGEMSAKDLRGSSMMDVIFAGAEGYAPAGMAEVSLTLENDGGLFPAKYLKFSEIMVTRRLHRSGDSEYFINKEPARLRDVQEIFMDTGAGSKGFSIIQQGMIGKIITAKPEDRRMLIEEAAGITKFKARKKESQRKLEATDQNLIRLNDIIGEKKRSIDSLQRQAQKAERYRLIKKEIEEVDLALNAHHFKDLKVTSEDLQKNYLFLTEKAGSEEVYVNELSAKVEERKLAQLEQEKQVENLQFSQYELQSIVQKNELELQALKFELEQAKSREEMAGSLIQEQRARHELLSNENIKLLSDVETIAAGRDSLKSNYEDKKMGFEEAQSRIQDIDESLTSKRRELFALGQTESSLDARVNSMVTQIEEMQERQANELSVLQELKTKKLEYEDRRKRVTEEYDRERQLHLDLSNDVTSFEANKKILSEQISQKRTEVSEFKDKLNEVTSRLYGLENLHKNFEGFQEGVKQVMLWQKSKQAEITSDGSVYFQPVSESIEVPADYEVAMEAVLGTRLQTLLSKKPETVLDAVSFLKEKKAGRSSFLLDEPYNENRARTSLQQGQDGVEAILFDVVKAEGEHSGAARNLLSSVAVVDSLKTGLALRPQHTDWTFVTKDGDVLSSDGMITGGGKEDAGSGVLQRRREIKELSLAKDEWAGKLALAQQILKKLEEQLEGVINDFEGAQKRKIEQEIKVAGLRKDLERAETEVQNVDQACQRQDREIAKSNDQYEQLEGRKNELETNLASTKEKRTELEEEVNDLTQELESTKIGFDSLQSQVVELQIKFTTSEQELESKRKQLELVSRQIEELDKHLSKMSEESLRTGSFLSENQIVLEQRKLDQESKMIELDEVKRQVSALRNDFEIASAELRKMEEELGSKSKERTQDQNKANELQLRFEQSKMKEQYIVDQIRERYMLDIETIYENHLRENLDVAQSEASLKELKEKLSRIGDVNLSAIEEYDEVSKSYEFLVQQQQDLIGAKEQLRRVIDRINRVCAKRFRETFDLVNERFTRVFPVLFGGGESRLQLHEDPEKGEMGIEIIARPPGKKAQNISLLSGGEKALTAVALVFSIFLVKPSPYCLLDEVDAPLDDANVFRFNDLVREMSKRSQIIVVTHNKHTMDVAKKLYGVTMQERGVSTMVSVNLADVQG